MATESIRAVATLWHSSRFWAVLSVCATVIGAIFVAGFRVATWANDRASTRELGAVAGRCANVSARMLELERAEYGRLATHTAALRELAGAWAYERARVPRGSRDPAAERDAAAERARQHFSRLVLEQPAPEALRIAIRQTEVSR